MTTIPHAELIWLLAGLGLMLLELVSPGFVLFFFGLGAWTAALWAWGGVGGVTSQFFVFLISSLLFLVFLRKYGKAWFKGRIAPRTSGAELDDDFKGQRAVIVEEIVPKTLHGKVELHGTRWNAQAEAPIRRGVTVVVTERKGLTLHVKPLEP
jgi:membrane protein implicated in regulation of membrane protease activity